MKYQTHKTHGFRQSVILMQIKRFIYSFLISLPAHYSHCHDIARYTDLLNPYVLLISSVR